MTDTIDVQLVNFTEDFIVLSDDPGQAIYSDVTSPTDQPSIVRVSVKPRPNIYAGTDIDASMAIPNKGGLEVFVEVRDVLNVVDDDDASYLRQIPVRFAVAASLPRHPLFTAEQAEFMLARAVGAFLSIEDRGLVGLEAILHGSTAKK